jgi:tripartite-type tricarboxylate transporter receptor subunit TctC
MIQRRNLLQGIASIGALGWSGAFANQLALSKLLVGFPPGGTADALSRRLAEKLAGTFAQTVLVDSRPGAGGQIAAIALKQAASDGATLMVTPSSVMSMNPYTFVRLPYNPSTDAKPVSLVCNFDHAIAIGPMVPPSVKTLRDFLEFAKARPGAANYGTPGASGIPHLIGELLSKKTGSGLVNVPYKGSAPAIQDLLGGQIPSVVAPLGEYLPHLDAAGQGRLRVLAVAGPSRSKFLPGALTIKEQGVDIAIRDWFGLYAPPGTSQELVDVISSSARQALSNPELIAAFAKIGMEAAGSTAGQLAAIQAKDDSFWKETVRAVGFKPET